MNYPDFRCSWCIIHPYFLSLYFIPTGSIAEFKPQSEERAGKMVQMCQYNKSTISISNLLEISTVSTDNGNSVNK